MIKCPNCYESWDANTPGYVWALTMLNNGTLCPTCVTHEVKYVIKIRLQQLKSIRKSLNMPDARSAYHILFSDLMAYQTKWFPDAI